MKLLLFILQFVPIVSLAQTIPAERIFLCSNQGEYGWSDTIRVDGIVMSTDTTRLPESRYVCIDAFDPTDSLCMHMKLRCQPDGSFHLRMPAYAIGRTGRCLLRANTRLMLNYPAATLPCITVNIIAANAASPEATTGGWNCSEDLTKFDLRVPVDNKATRDEAWRTGKAFKAETQLAITGTATYRVDGRPVRNGSVMAWQRSNQQVYTAGTDRDGHFSIPVDDYFNGEEFYLQAYDKKGKDYACNFELDEDVIPPLFHDGRLSPISPEEVTNANARKGGLFQVNVLPEVTVRSHRKAQDIDKENKKYYGTHYLGREDFERRHILKLEDIVQYFTAFMYLGVDREGNDALYSRRESILNVDGRAGGTPVRIVVDGVTWEFSELQNLLNVDDLEEVAYLSPNEAQGVRGVRFAHWSLRPARASRN